jgi:hypothetical protein
MVLEPLFFLIFFLDQYHAKMSRVQKGFQGCGGEAGDGGIQVLLTGDFEAFGTPNNINCRLRASVEN